MILIYIYNAVYNADFHVTYILFCLFVDAKRNVIFIFIYMTRRTRHLNNWPTWIKDNRKQHLLGKACSFVFVYIHCLLSVCYLFRFEIRLKHMTLASFLVRKLEKYDYLSLCVFLEVLGHTLGAPF
jgi:hypothetical protein